MTALGPVISAAGGGGGEGRADSPSGRWFSAQGLQKQRELALKSSPGVQAPVSLEPEGVGNIPGQSKVAVTAAIRPEFP